jgi:hypothetical protein
LPFKCNLCRYHLAPFFALDERVMYSPKPQQQQQGGANNKKPPVVKQVPGRITSVDASMWPPSYMFCGDASTSHRDTEGGRLIAEVGLYCASRIQL